MVVLRIIYIMFDSLKLQVSNYQTFQTFFFESTFYQYTSCISTDMEIVTTFYIYFGQRKCRRLIVN